MANPLLFVVIGAWVAYILYTRISLYIARRRLILKNGCQPCFYTANKDPIFGLDILRINMRAAKSRTTLATNHGRFLGMKTHTFRSRVMNIPLIATCEPENIKTALSLKFKDYSLGLRKKTFGPLLGDGIFNADGERWANSRHLLRPNFAREQVADLEAFERHFQLFLQHVPTDGSPVDLQDLFFKLTIDTATEFLFNHSTNILKRSGPENDANNEDAAFSKAFTFAQADILTRMRLGFLDPLRKNQEGKDAIKICQAYVDRWVDEAVAWREEQQRKEKAGEAQKEEERYVFIHELAKQTNDKARIRHELMNVLLAGRDTTASLLSNMFFEIAKRPDIYAKLREEVASLDGRPPSYEELKNMKFVKWCINESLRLHPVVPGNTRLAIRDTILPRGGGPSGASPLFVPAGTLLGYSPWALHRREDFYGPTAHLFDPFRWESLRPGWEYLPFNGGPRICLGQQYALTEAGYVTARLVQSFEAMESRDVNGGVWVEGLTLTCCSGNGTRVSLTLAS
ncbi:n-alkane-inducible cytochrome P450 [Corynespora cassiicola Philippines]|uniref:N-alkane-inducible cytochrome P450 n=1 Tax=Corynespora cassiicola Philippines TaxID=1448308 RepID=A0A2T2NPS0_CORCC|nr:n-alkane-inducible cytochrome P450 [Corynespora cassiicola Philippines]